MPETWLSWLRHVDLPSLHYVSKYLLKAYLVQFISTQFNKKIIVLGKRPRGDWDKYSPSAILFFLFVCKPSYLLNLHMW